MGDISIKGRSPLLKGGRVGFKQGGAYGPLRGTTAGGVAKAFRGKEGFKESQKLQKLKFKKFKKIIKKTPDKKFRQDETYELSTGKFGKIISGKTQKKKIIQQETEIKRNFEAKGQEWKSPIKLQGGGAATHGLGKAFLKGGKA